MNMDDANDIQTSESERDLGVVFDERLNFDVHINNLINKANKVVGVVKRSFIYLCNGSFITLYKSLIRPHLEYANCIWSPMFKRQSISLENVQRRATKLVSLIAHLNYEERMKYLSLPSLK